MLQENPSWAQRTPLGTKGTPKISRKYLLRTSLDTPGTLLCLVQVLILNLSDVWVLSIAKTLEVEAKLTLTRDRECRFSVHHRNMTDWTEAQQPNKVLPILQRVKRTKDKKSKRRKVERTKTKKIDKLNSRKVKQTKTKFIIVKSLHSCNGFLTYWQLYWSLWSKAKSGHPKDRVWKKVFVFSKLFNFLGTAKGGGEEANNKT